MKDSMAIRMNKKLYYGWVIVFISALSMFFSAPGQTYSISAFIKEYTVEFGYSQTDVSVIYSIATFISGSILVFMGKLLDRFGQKKMFFVVGILLAVATFYNSFVSSMVMMGIGFFVLRYFGQGSMVLIPSTLVPQWFKVKRGLAFSLFKFGGTIATIVVPIFNVYCINTYGWRATWRIWSLLLLICFVPIAYVLTIDTPESIGLRPDNLNETTDKDSKEFIEESWHLSEAIKTKAFWIIGFVSSLTPMITTGMVFHFYSIMAEQGINDTSASYILGLMGIPGFFLPIIGGALVDKIGAKKVMAITLLMMSTAVFIMSQGKTQGVLMFATLLYGAGMGTHFVASGVLWPNFFGRKYLGSIQGAATVFGVLGSSFGTIPFGLSYDMTGSYAPILIGMALLSTVGAVVTLFIHAPVKGHEQMNH